MLKCRRSLEQLIITNCQQMIHRNRNTGQHKIRNNWQSGGRRETHNENNDYIKIVVQGFPRFFCHMTATYSRTSRDSKNTSHRY